MIIIILLYRLEVSVPAGPHLLLMPGLAGDSLLLSLSAKQFVISTTSQQIAKCKHDY